MLVEECGCEITKGRSMQHFRRSDPITVYQNTVLFLCKSHRSKIKNSAKGNQDEKLEERNQKGHESKCAGLIFHHFLHINVSLRV